MRLSFNDKESFMEAAGSLCFNNFPSDPNTLQVGSSISSSILSQDSERNEDIDIFSLASDPNTVESSLSMPPQERS
jgi:hypothetical protein